MKAKMVPVQRIASCWVAGSSAMMMAGTTMLSQTRLSQGMSGERVSSPIRGVTFDQLSSRWKMATSSVVVALAIRSSGSG